MHPSSTLEPSPSSTPAIATLVSLGIALLSIASAAILIKFSEQEMNPYATAFNRFWMTAVILGVWNGLQAGWQWWQRRGDATTSTSFSCSQSFSLPVFGQLCLVGLFIATDLMLWAWSLTQTSVANATLLANLTPVFSCLGGWLLLRKQFDRRFVLGMGVAIAAIFLIGLDDWQIDLTKLVGDGASLIAAISFSGYLAVVEQLQDELTTTTILFWSSAIAAFVALPVVLLAGGNLFPVSLQGWLAVGSLAIICQILGQGMLVHSLHKLSSEFVALFLLLEPILAGIGAWILFSEQLSVLNIIAFAIALIGIYISMSSPSAMREETDPIYLGELTVELTAIPHPIPIQDAIDTSVLTR